MSVRGCAMPYKSRVPVPLETRHALAELVARLGAGGAMRVLGVSRDTFHDACIPGGVLRLEVLEKIEAALKGAPVRTGETMASTCAICNNPIPARASQDPERVRACGPTCASLLYRRENFCGHCHQEVMVKSLSVTHEGQVFCCEAHLRASVWSTTRDSVQA